jgi:hypothetical protein
MTSVDLIRAGLKHRLKMAGAQEFSPRIHVVELAPFGFRYYRGAFESFEEAPPRYTWRRVDYGMDDTTIYVDMLNSDTGDARTFMS